MDFRIHKIKPWEFKFSIDGQKYFLHEPEEGGVQLYKFDCDELGRYKCECLAGRDTPIGRFIPYGKHGETYRDLSKGELWCYGRDAGMRVKAPLVDVIIGEFGESLGIDGKVVEGIAVSLKRKRFIARRESLLEELREVEAELEQLR